MAGLLETHGQYKDTGKSSKRGQWLRFEVTCPHCQQTHLVRAQVVEIEVASPMRRFCNVKRQHYLVLLNTEERTKALAHAEPL